MQIRWVEQSQADVPGHDEWLGPAERARLAGLHIPKRRADWRLGRWTAKLALTAWLGSFSDHSTLATLEIIPAATGAPEAFIGGQQASVSISISHCNGHALCALSSVGHIVGCDLERIEERSPAFVSDYFTTTEQAAIAGCANTDRNRLVALLWSAKESTLKTLRTGLRLDTREVSVEVADALAKRTDTTWREMRARYAGQEFAGWWREDENLVRTCVSDPPSERPPLELALTAISSL